MANGGGKPESTDPSQNTVFEGGKEQYKDDAVEVRTGVTASTIDKPVADPVKACADPSKTPTGVKDGITIKVKCKKDPHVVQFIYREILDKDGKAVGKQVTTTGGTYQTTTDPAKPNWNTDSSSKPNPYYEGGFMSRKDSDALTTLDQPGFGGIVAPPPGGTSRATFKAYAFCDGKVIREISWTREQKDGSDPAYTTSVQKADALPDWANKQLKTNGYNAVP